LENWVQLVNCPTGRIVHQVDAEWETGQQVDGEQEIGQQASIGEFANSSNQQVYGEQVGLNNRKLENRIQFVDWPTGGIGQQVDGEQVRFGQQEIPKPGSIGGLANRSNWRTG
jgi:hypothetical protein